MNTCIISLHQPQIFFKLQSYQTQTLHILFGILTKTCYVHISHIPSPLCMELFSLFIYLENMTVLLMSRLKSETGQLSLDGPSQTTVT